MASITEYKKGWRAFVAKNGVRTSKTFKTKAEAKSWAAKKESELDEGSYLHDAKKTLADAIDLYLETVSPLKKSHSKEALRLNSIKANFGGMVRKNIIDVKPADIAHWRDARLKKVKPSTVNREANILRSLFSVAKKEWGWIRESPFESVKLPNNPAPRTRRITAKEIKSVCRELGYVTGKIETKSQETALAFLISLRTAMRSGEILSLNEGRADLKNRVLIVPHKMQYVTGEERQIPITKQAAKLIGYLADRGQYFTVSDGSRDTLFRNAVKELGIKDLHFHDARAEALTRLSRKVDVMTLAKISGHKDLKVLLNTYYRESAADIAKRLL